MDGSIGYRYAGVHLPPVPNAATLAGLREDYSAIIATQFTAILDRTERGQLYPWIDTRLDLSTGRDLPAPDLPVVSGWVQGRGLEGLAAFGGWLAGLEQSPETDLLLGRVRQLARDLQSRMASVYARHGHHYFAMSPDGSPPAPGPLGVLAPLRLSRSDPANYSDLFASKGLYAAARFLGDSSALAAARGYCLAVYGDIMAGRFRTDQPQPAALASVVSPAGGLPHGPYMIALGMAVLFVRHEPGPESTEMGLRLARRVLYGHTNLHARWPGLREDDLVEFIGSDGAPYVDPAGRIPSDPGHSVEFVGLFLKFSTAARREGRNTPEQAGELAHMESLMPGILSRAFENGFVPGLGGIRKSLDLRTRQPIDDTMPWWSLPETIRAAAEMAAVAGDAPTKSHCLTILAQSHNAFVDHYVRPGVHLMAVKLRDANGRVSEVVPAYPDADPGYHTALSLLDVLPLIVGSP